jgi:hypothetical protein
MNTSLETSEAEALPCTDTLTNTQGQLLVLASLLEEALKVVRVVIADSIDEEFDLQQLVDQGDAAVKAVLLQSMNAASAA